ncbi:MAG: hypothetical protein INR65_16805 [Gluconacetobacter diazotrophicus]|nr:hypothetical protein [Gluconacetobacter diazotrophicus]
MDESDGTAAMPMTTVPAAAVPKAVPAAATRLPWEIHPALSEDRLRVCAAMLANARRDAVRMASPEMGDDSWSIGCRAYSFGRRRLQRAAERGSYNWLTVLDGSHHFVFLIEEVPVRFFRGAADGPTPRTLRRHASEADQLGLALGPQQAEGLVFRFALEAEAASGVERVVFLALRGEEGEAECFWPVPLDDAVDPRPPSFSPRQLLLLGDDAEARTVRLAPPRRTRSPDG